MNIVGRALQEHMPKSHEFVISTHGYRSWNVSGGDLGGKAKKCSYELLNFLLNLEEIKMQASRSFSLSIVLGAALAMSGTVFASGDHQHSPANAHSTMANASADTMFLKK